MKRVTNRQWVFMGWFTISSLGFSWLLLGPFGDLFRNLGIRLGLFSLLILISVLILRKTWDEYRFRTALLVSMIGYAVIYEIATYLPGINNYPFTLTWSEGSAYYFASAYFSERLYGVEVDLPLTRL